ncbi:MAG: hypothetical protein L6V93_04910 [Clostridiales bacterium]|nr:MAG: hypothetical protein L6V93_04910 [Clostridiales bacterium]
MSNAGIINEKRNGQAERIYRHRKNKKTFGKRNADCGYIKCKKMTPKLKKAKVDKEGNYAF